MACACGRDPALPGPNTRRVRGASFRDLAGPGGPGHPFHGAATSGVSGVVGGFVGHDLADFPGRLAGDRSEEHTSELQSLMRSSYAVFCMKKKNTIEK